MQLPHLCLNISDKGKRLLSTFLPSVLDFCCAIRYKQLHTVCGFVDPFTGCFYHLYKVHEAVFCALSNGANLVQDRRALKQATEQLAQLSVSCTSDGHKYLYNNLYDLVLQGLKAHT